MPEIKSKTTRIPKLRVSDKVKRANDFEHTKSVMDHYISASTFVDERIDPTVRDIRLFYMAYNNQLPEEYFHYVTNPLNTANKDYTNWPARLRPYSIIRPNIDLLQGEYEKRPFAFVVKVHNSDAANQYQEGQYKTILRTLEQQFINKLNEKGMQTGMESQPVEPPEKIKELMVSNFRDQRAVVAEAALDIIIDQQQVEETFKKLFHDWLIAGECYTYKGLRGGRMVHERVSPLDVDFDKSADREVEDGQWFCRRMYMTPAEINDSFYKELEEKEIDLIEDENGHLSMRAVGTGMQATIRDDQDLRRSKVVVYHVVWKYLVKTGILSFVNELGELQQVEVPETYVPDKARGESVEWFWINEVWEGYRIADSIYLGIQPEPNQRNIANNMSVCRLPYNGRRFSDTHSRNISPVEMGLPYEILHRILHFNLEKTIAKSKGKIALLDIGAIPKKDGWTEDKFFYHAEANGFGLLDRMQPGADRTFNQYNVLDLGLYGHITNLIEVMNYVKDEWDQLLGITRQRKGEVKASDTDRGTQAAINQSAVISEYIYSRFEEFVRRELEGLLDVSKLAWADGFQTVHQSDDMRNILIQIDPANYSEMEFGVYISRNARDLQNLELVRQQVQAFAQNGVPPSSIVNVVQARSLSKLRTILLDAERKSLEAQERVQAGEAEREKQLELIRGAFEELKGYLAERQIHVKYDREEDLELLKQSGVDQNPNPVIDPGAAQKVALDDENKKRELGLKERTEAVKAKQKDRELDLKERELKVRKQIADKQARVALKNKVVGESSKQSKK